METKDRLYIEKVVENIDFIFNNTNNISEKELENNKVLLDSVVFRLIQISENIDRISDSVKKNNNHIPWKDIKGLRNRLVHDYGNVILDFVYNTITIDLKILKEYFLNL